MDEPLCTQCGSRSIRIRRKTAQRLRYRGSRRYRCLGCDTVFLIARQGQHIREAAGDKAGKADKGRS